MQNINPTHNRNRRALFYLSIIGLPLLLGGCTAAASVALLTQFPAFGSYNTVVIVLLVLLALPAMIGGGIAVYRGLTLERDNDLALRVGQELAGYLDGRYTLIRNVSQRRLGYIDAVLIGPPGALVLRIVDYTGYWRNEMVEWKHADRQGRLRPASTNPTRECARDVYALRKYFAKGQLDKIPVFGVVVFTTQGVRLEGSSPVIPIAETHLLMPILESNYLAEEQRIDRRMAESAIRLLS